MKAQITRMDELAHSLIDTRFSAYISPGWAAAFMRFCIEFYARFGTDLTYLTWGLGITDRHPTMAHLIQARSPRQRQPTFFLSPQLYKRVRDLAVGWSIIPIIGDLRDPELAQRLSSWNDQVAPVRGIYTSNVENYLVTRGSWANYYNFMRALKQLTLADDAVIIKAFFQYDTKRHPLQIQGYHDCVFAQRVSDLLHMFDQDKLREPEDIFLKVPYIDPAP